MRGDEPRLFGRPKQLPLHARVQVDGQRRLRTGLHRLGRRRLGGLRTAARSGPVMPAPPLAALFWFYKQAAVCANHLALFRRHNEGLPVYGLYGGPPDEAAAFEATL